MLPYAPQFKINPDKQDLITTILNNFSGSDQMLPTSAILDNEKKLYRNGAFVENTMFTRVFNADGKVISSVYNSRNLESWLSNFVRKNTRDANGKVETADVWNINYDLSDSGVGPTYKYRMSFEYDNQNRFVKGIAKEFVPRLDGWYYSIVTKNEYQADGRISSKRITWYNLNDYGLRPIELDAKLLKAAPAMGTTTDDPHLYGKYRFYKDSVLHYYYSYDDAGRKATVLKNLKSPGRTTFGYVERFTAYYLPTEDKFERVVKEKMLKWNWPRYVEQELYTWGTGTVEIVNQQFSDDDQWVNNKKIIQDVNSDPKTLVIQDWTDGQWVNSEKYDNYYGSYNFPDVIDHFKWNSDLQTWELNSKETATIR